MLIDNNQLISELEEIKSKSNQVCEFAHKIINECQKDYEIAHQNEVDKKSYKQKLDDILNIINN